MKIIMCEKCFHISTTDEPILYLKQQDSRLADLIDDIGEIVCHEHVDDFSFIASEIVGQMLSNKVADILFDRLRELCLGEVTPKAILDHTIDELRSIGISKSKAACLHDFAVSIVDGNIDLQQFHIMNTAEVIERLTKVKGIGPWTAKMYALFVLRHSDVLPYEDGAFLQSYKWLYETTEVKPKTIITDCRKWQPYSSYAARYLYRALDVGYTQMNVHDIVRG